MFQVFSIFLGIIISFIVFDDHINSLINKQINNQEYIEKLSHSLRPFLIFDQNEIKLYDHGADKFIDNIKTKFHESFMANQDVFVDTIFIYFNKFFQTAPLLESIGPLNYNINSKRCKNNKWLYTLESINWPDPRPNSIFRIEILK